MVDDIRKQEVIEQYRQVVFEEPGGFVIEYEQCNDIPVLHFHFLSRVVDRPLCEMVEIAWKECEEVLRDLGKEFVMTYTRGESTCRWAKKRLGYQLITKADNWYMLRKDL